MKKNITKRILAALLAAALAFSLAACGGGNNAGGSEGEDTASTALTEEEYQQAVEDLSTEMSEIQTNASTAMTDPEAAKGVLEEMKASINDFASVTPPEAYADAHEKLKSGCESLIAFIDTVAAMSEETDQTKIAEMSTQMSEQLQAAMTDMAEGASMLEGVSE